MALGGITIVEDAFAIRHLVQRVLKWQTNEHVQESTISYTDTVKVSFHVKDSKQWQVVFKEP